MENRKWWEVNGGMDNLRQEDIDKRTDRTYQIMEGMGKRFTAVTKVRKEKPKDAWWDTECRDLKNAWRREKYRIATLEAPTSYGGYLVNLEGLNGSMYPLEWSSKKHAAAGTSIGDSESIEWARAAKAAMRIACMVEHVTSD